MSGKVASSGVQPGEAAGLGQAGYFSGLHQ
jgi:hypothetical protein